MASKVDLVHNFDELMRITSILTTGYEHDEAEFIKFVQNQELCRQKWQCSEMELSSLRRGVGGIQEERDSLEIKLKHARSMVNEEMKKRMKAETQMECLERQVALIRELLCDKDQGDMKSLARVQLEKHLSAIEDSLSSANFSEDSIQPNSEDLDFSKTRSGYLFRQSLDRNRRSREEVMATAPPVELDDDLNDVSKHITFEDEHFGELKGSSVHVTTSTTVALATLPESSKAPPLERDFRKPPAMKDRRGPSRQHVKNMAGMPGSSRVLIEETASSDSVDGPLTPDVTKPTVLPQMSSVMMLQSRGHTFCSKTVIKPESCQPCGKKIHFGSSALRCKDCRAVCHPDCKSRLPLPCLPYVSTPSKKNKTEMFLESYCPSRRPKIPAIVVHCIQEVERRGLNDVGLYRVSGSDRDVRDLKERFLRGKGNPDLIKISDVNVICGALKDFFRCLKESLLTSALFETFSAAAEAEHNEESLGLMFQAITELPTANKDTLACLVLHLQNVSAHSAQNKMVTSSLAKIFGPTIVGYSVPNPSPATMLQDTKKQPVIIEKLLGIPGGFWQQFLMSDEEANGSNSPVRKAPIRKREGLSTPEPRPILGSMFGTVEEVPGSTPRQMKRQPFMNSKRPGGKAEPSAKRGRFFSSPQGKK